MGYTSYFDHPHSNDEARLAHAKWDAADSVWQDPEKDPYYVGDEDEKADESEEEEEA